MIKDYQSAIIFQQNECVGGLLVNRPFFDPPRPEKIDIYVKITGEFLYKRNILIFDIELTSNVLESLIPKELKDLFERKEVKFSSLSEASRYCIRNADLTISELKKFFEPNNQKQVNHGPYR